MDSDKGPRKPPTAYVLYCKEKRQELVDANPEMSFGDIGRTLGQMWSKLSPEQQKEYTDISHKRMDKWKAEYEQWKRTHPNANRRVGKKGLEKVKSKKSRDPAAPKRPQSGYMFFSLEVRPRLKQQQPGVSFSDLGRMIGEAWKQLPDSQRSHYQALADKDRQRYETELAKYRGQPVGEAESPSPSEE